MSAAHRIRVHAIRTREVDAFPPWDAVEGTHLVDWFAGATNQALQLEIRERPEQLGGPTVNGAMLHGIQQSVLPPGPGLTKDVALIFARSWTKAEAGVKGVMYDWNGFDAALGTMSSGGDRPRQGCAVFLDDARTQRDAIFTAIHELGHLFNLSHGPSDSFMASSGGQPGFSGDDCERLVAAAHGDHTFAPGGDNFIGGIGSRQSDTRRSSRLELTGDCGRDAYLVGEPIVFDLTLRGNEGKVATALPQLDPGHPNLSIWIQNPRGEVMRHAPHLTFCRSASPQTSLAGGRALRNSPRIAWGRAGLNFSYPGEYLVWAKFSPGGPTSRTYVDCNPVEISIRPSTTDADVAISNVLRRPGPARFLTDKGGVLDAADRRALLQLVKRYPEHPALQYVRYALAIEANERGQKQRTLELLKSIRLPAASLRRGAKRLERKLRSL